MGSSRRRRRRDQRRQRRGIPQRLPPVPGDAAWRWVAGIATVVAATVVTYWSYEWADPYGPGVGPYLDRAEGALRDDGYGIVVFCVAVVLIGALFQAPVAVRRDADIGGALLAVLGFVVFMLLVAWSATFLAPLAPQLDPSRGRGDPGALYGATLVSLLGTPAALVVGGAVFVRRRSGPGLGGLIAAAGLIGGMVGVACLTVLAAVIVVRLPAVRAWAPPGGGAFLVIGAIAVGGLCALAFAVAVSGLFGRGLPVRAMRRRGVSAVALLGVAGYFGVSGLLGAQLGGVLPGWLVSLLAFLWLVGSGVGILWLFVRPAWRTGQPAQDG